MNYSAEKVDEIYAIAKEAYFYAYPIVSMDVTMRQATNVPDANSINMRAPLNQFAHVRSYPRADEKDVAMRKAGAFVNGWNIGTETMGTYGTSYKRRAFVALGGLGCNLPEDAVYPTAFVDGEGQPLSGANQYLLHFEKGKNPPANAFWSITMYDKEGFQVPNPIDRFAIGDRDNLTFNPDGSLDLYIQRESPGKDKESNWLPAPQSGLFTMNLRLYWPKAEALNGTWVPPSVKQVK